MTAEKTEENKEEALENEERERRVYEIGFLLIPSLSEDEVAREVADLRKTIEETLGSDILSEGYPKMQALEYIMELPHSVPKQKYDHAYFGWIKFEALPEKSLELKDSLKRSRTVIRSLVIQTERDDALTDPRSSAKDQKHADDDTDTEQDTRPSQKADVSEEEIDKSIEELIVS